MTVNSYRYRCAVLSVAGLGAIALTQTSFLSDFLNLGAAASRPLSLMPVAYAQEFTDDDVINYANTVVSIEAQRIADYETASDILAASGGEVDILEAQLSCQAHKLSDMPDIPRASRVDLQAVLVEFCEGSRLSAESNDLTAKRFNSMTAAHRADPALAERIQGAISEL